MIKSYSIFKWRRSESAKDRRRVEVYNCSSLIVIYFKFVIVAPVQMKNLEAEIKINGLGSYEIFTKLHYYESMGKEFNEFKKLLTSIKKFIIFIN